MKRRLVLQGAAAAATPFALEALAAETAPATADAGLKVLRVYFPVAETGFDPPQLSDRYSRTVTAHIFDAPYDFDHLARPVKLRLRVAAALPASSADFKVWTVRLKPGVLFDNDPAFAAKGVVGQRELVAQDYVYSFKRFADPATKSQGWPAIDELEIVGLRELRQAALKAKAPFDYDREIEGLRALDRYTLQFRLARGNPRFAENLTDSSWIGACAREVVEFYGDKIMEHPVGTGPYRLARWRRSSQMILEKNPNFRLETWSAEPTADDAEGQAIARRMTGRRLPMIDRVQIDVIGEAQPAWLSFLNGALDLLPVPQEFVPVATPGGVLMPNLRKRGIQAWRVLLPTSQLQFFNMEDPVVGGYTPAQVALRRAIGLGTDVRRIIDRVYRGQAVPAQAISAPYTSGYEAGFRSENGDYSPARARALLDLYGYTDRDNDGFRERPDGSRLVLEMATQAEGLSRQLDELMQKDLKAIGLKVVFKPAQWPENLKAARAGKLQMWRVGTSSTVTDGQEVLQRLYGPQVGQGNIARFKLPAFDAVYDQLLGLPDGPERQARFEQAKRIAIAYMPYKVLLHQYVDVVAQPWLEGYRRPLFWNHYFHMVDIDLSLRPRAA